MTILKKMVGLKTKGRKQSPEEKKMRAVNQIRGKKHHNWKGGVTYKRPQGNYSGVKYVRCPKEYLAMARKDGYVMEHRLIVAMILKRPLIRAEAVHHIDHNPRNNSITNLMLFSTNQEHKQYEGGWFIIPLWQKSNQ
jgi:hypothetical protein